MLVPLIDVEEMNSWNSKTFHKNLKQFLKMIETHYGVKPMIYCVNSFYNKHLSYGYSDYKFMVGRYGKNSPNMKRGQWTIWQFSETGVVKGIERKVDVNKLSKNYQLKDLLIKGL
jgi:lysozyme